MAAIMHFIWCNLMGLRMSSQTQNVLMIIKIGMLLVIIAALFFPAIHSTAPIVIDESKTTAGALLLSFGVALKATSFTYGGYQQTINFGEEIENPQKNNSERNYYRYYHYYIAVSSGKLFLCQSDRV